jgi:hypothetical protein
MIHFLLIAHDQLTARIAFVRQGTFHCSEDLLPFTTILFGGLRSFQKTLFPFPALDPCAIGMPSFADCLAFQIGTDSVMRLYWPGLNRGRRVASCDRESACLVEKHASRRVATIERSPST